MQERRATPDVIERQIRFALAQLRVRNEHHVFEELCRHFAQARISRNVLPATGPVSAGGDQGRDFETFHSYIADQLPEAFVSEDRDERVVFLCTLQTRGLQRKIKHDVAKAVAGGQVGAVYAFCEADLPVAKRHQLEGWAQEEHDLRLQILDGRGLSAQLVSPDLFWIAEQFLSLPASLQHRRLELRRYLDAARQPPSSHPYRFGLGPSGSPPPELATVYQHQAVVDRTRSTADAGPSIPRATEPDPGAQTPLTCQELLQRHHHVLLLGEPGLGKSTLLRHLTADVATTAWLEDRPVPYVPVRLHARHLASGKPLAEAIRDGAVAELGTKLTRELPVWLFDSEPQPGLPWLVLVDGIDEVQDPTRRAAALQAVVDGCRQPFWRFLVASRALPARDLVEVREHCRQAELLPFDPTTVTRFAGQWFEQRKLPDPPRLAKRLLGHLRSMGYDRKVQTPLTAAMLCWLLSDNPHRALPMHRSGLYHTYVDLLARSPDEDSSPLVRELHAHSLSVLTKVAYRRQADYDETPVLAAAIADIEERGLRPPPYERSGWERTVHDALCQTGLVVPSAKGELTFSHQTMEAYLAACHLAEVLAGLDDSARVDRMAQLRNDLVGHRDMLSFLGEIWVSQGCDLDLLAAELLDDSATGALELIHGFVDTGLPLGMETASLLERIATNWRNESADRLVAAVIMARIDPPASGALLLALTIDLDMDDSDRVAAIQALHATNPATAAALWWLMWFTDYGHPDPPYKSQANQLLTGLNREAEAEAAGLQLLVTNRYLPDRYRAWAGAVLVDQGVHGAYEALKSTMAPRDLTLALAELLERGNPEAWAVLRRLSQDRKLPSTERQWAAEELALCDPDL